MEYKEIDAYIESKKEIWSVTTQRSERYRLYRLSSTIDGDPDKLWHRVLSAKPYTRVTIWTRVIGFWDFYRRRSGDQSKSNPYRAFREENPQVFRNCYSRSPSKIEFKDVQHRIESIRPSSARSLAERILESGERYSEAIQSQDKDSQIIGKGNKRRVTYRAKTGSGPIHCDYWNFRRTLREVGLKPHDIRKAFLSRLVELGANEFELCSIAGWSSISTASSYITVNSSRLIDLVKRIDKYSVSLIK